MSRRVTTVRELWTEWHVGLCGCPSVEFLENTCGRKWRLSSKKAKYFSRRHRVIRYVQSLLNRDLSVDDALDKADENRGKRSIDAFSKFLNSKKTF
ncbi:Short-chain dehydrogenase [Phytophthora megakarya]|uniref:Short-chain dehydrogenase n=1 Tax=Phytophthora megakarya TaxID=4795 RepID=A0A225VHK2_9STRA|nr:Short-chain dehydrogenase [Phytophthora megakarya]